ncbi:TonB-dependent receptor [Nibribacter ruber]|uniref:TonB-dependent receptor n=1 Tax=Nibribacter ruber TaxID=2698458 RepID=A0A6P1P048_9BACT|nr:TonB-dependent receptor [Nibribacter ruber]QHL87658.1 TonB-dependent receptor [Nibribacter ruber]
MKHQDKLFTLLFFLLLATVPAWAQETSRYELKGKLQGTKAEPLLAANIQLVKDPSMELVKVEVSAEDGSFIFSNLPAGTYKLMATHYDYATYQSGVIKLDNNLNLGDLVMPERAVALKEIKIEQQKPLVEQHFDKTVLNVENSIASTGSTVLEVLEKAPGVNIDQNDNISMRGKGGVIVMVDGKPVPMSGAELANMLRGMGANTVAKIDLITNPSAKYDAAGNAGIIDIRLKKDNRVGTNGTLSSSFGMGMYPKANQGLQLNHRNRNVNVFGSYNYVHRNDINKLDLYRQFYEVEETDTEGPKSSSLLGIYDQKNVFGHIINGHNGRVGADYTISPKTIVGIVGSGAFTDINRTVNNRADVLDGNKAYQSSFLTNGFTGTNRNNQALNLNLKHTIDTTGREISADVDYAAFQTRDLQNINISFVNAAKPQSDSTLFSDLDGELSIYSAKVDYAQPLKAMNANLEAGVKSSLVKADNNLQFFDRSEGRNDYLDDKSNHFLYSENINAAYLNLNKKWTKLSLQLGLRLENTQAEGKQLITHDDFDRSYTQLFPSAYVGYTVSEKHDVGLSLSRRIDRPTYNQLNPFRFLLDHTTYSQGNPALKPQLTYSFEFTHTLLQKFVTKLSYSRTTDVMVSVLSPTDETTEDGKPIVKQQDQNLAQLDYYGATLSLPITVARWFTSTNNLEIYYGLYQGNLANTNLRNGRPTFNLNSNNSFLLPNNWSAELIGVYRAREIYGFLDVNPVKFVSVGVQKQFLDKKASLKLNVSDVFYSNKTRATTELTGYAERFYQRRDTRVATLSFTYRFGKSQVAPSRRRTGGAEEEKRRAG